MHQMEHLLISNFFCCNNSQIRVKQVRCFSYLIIYSIFIILNNLRKMKVLLLSSIIQIMLLEVLGQTNFVQNGGFEDPLITVTSTITNSIPFWTGSFELVKAGIITPFTGTQIMDLSTTINGFMEQAVSLPVDGIYSLSFVAKDRAQTLTTYNESVAEVYWNGVNVLVCRPQPQAIVAESINITGNAGLNKLKFVEIGSNNSLGLLIDDVQIYLIKEIKPIIPTEQIQTTTEKVVKIASNAASNMPLNHFKLVQLLCLIQDISLYPYANRNYSQKVSNIFNRINDIETTKWNFYLTVFNLSLTMPVSNYSLYSSPMHLKMDGKDDSLIQNIYPFLIFTIPQTIAIVGLLKLIFHCLQNNKVSLLFRRFSFFQCAVLQTIFEGNISFFAYLSFNQFQILFSFTIIDKAFLVFAVVFFWICLAHGICFYFIVNYLYEKKLGYFLYCYYRNLTGFSFVTIKIGVRSIIRGVIFSTLQSDYFTQCILLITVELFLIAISIKLQTKHEIYIYESKFCLHILNHSLLVGMTAFLLVENSMESEHLKVLLELAVLICIYGMGIVAFLDFIVEICSHKRVYSQQFLALDKISQKHLKRGRKLQKLQKKSKFHNK